MRAAVLLLWAGCLYAIARSVCCLLWMASPRRQLLTLAVLALAVSPIPICETAKASGQKREAEELAVK